MPAVVRQLLFTYDAKFRKSARGEAGKTYESWFEKLLERIKFNSKKHKLLVTSATAHFGELRAQLAARNESRQLVHRETLKTRRGKNSYESEDPSRDPLFYTSILLPSYLLLSPTPPSLFGSSPESRPSCRSPSTERRCLGLYASSTHP